VALKIVRATGDESVKRPLRLWYAGRHDEALDLIGGAAGAAHADDATQLVPLVLAADLAHAARVGAALAAWDDDIAGYRILKAACESLIDELASVGASRWVSHAAALITIVQPWLDRTPAEPLLLDYLGVALYGVNEAPIAVRILEAAYQLDASVENIAGNLAAARERAHRPIRLVLAPRDRGLIEARRDWLKRLGKRAVSYHPPVRISLCMIVRNEEEMLPACLASCQSGVDEMIIVDTGSTDRTVAIAESFGARVLHFPWTGSFSDARNHGLAEATGSHILWLDADEQLEDGDAPLLAALAQQSWREGHWLVETNFTGQDEVGTAANHLAFRLWRNRPGYRFTGAIHEQIRTSTPTDLRERFAVSTLRIRHYGYLNARIEDRQKHQRNLELLERELAADPNSAFTHFNVGTEYLVMDDITRARQHLEQAFELLAREPAWWEMAYAPILVSRLVGIRRKAGDLNAAETLAGDALLHYPRFTDLVFERGLCGRLRGDLDHAAQAFTTCLEMGDAPAGLTGVAGRGSFLALNALAAIANERGDVTSAVGWLEQSLERYPQYLTAGLELADVLLGLPDADPEQVVRRLEAVGNDQATWWLFLATALYDRGHAVIAEELFRRAVERNPGSDAAHVGLAETLLTQHRYREVVADQHAAAQATTPWFALVRSRALAAFLLGDDEAVAAQGAAYAAGGGDVGEAALIDALASLARGETPPVLSPASAPAAFLILDALARLREFDAFERVVPVATASVGDQRAADVALAEVFFSHGFYRLAADRALAAVDRGGPDARTLTLLGKSAVAEGLFADAVPVLQASLALDPDQPSVRTLLGEVEKRVA
jgi:glycosyltransferase involved in cell wall biosynthesis